MTSTSTQHSEPSGREGVSVTLPRGHQLLNAPAAETDRIAAVVAMIASTLLEDPVDLLALKRLSDKLTDRAGRLGDELDVASWVVPS